MKKKFVLIILIAAIFLLLNNEVTFALQKKIYNIPDNTSLLNIIVNKGDEFSVEIDGPGWYANRYSRDKISILLRVVDDNKTRFDIKANAFGEAYIFFSLIGQDKYLHILIKKINGVGEREKPTSHEAENKKLTIAKKVLESKKEKIELGSTDKNKVIKKSSEVVKPQNNSKVVEKKKEPQIYFIDKKDNKKVNVPFEDENKDYYEAINQLKNNNNQKAINLFNSYLDKCEDCKYKNDAIFYIANTYVSNGEKDKAFKYYKKIISIGRGKYYKESLKWMGDYYYDKKDLKKAIDIFQKLFSETKNYDIIRKIADIAYSLGEVEQSLEGYNYCIQHDKIDDEILFRLASIYDKPGKFRNIEKAYNFYHKIVESYPKSKYFDISKRRVLFFERNFINIE